MTACCSRRPSAVSCAAPCCRCCASRRLRARQRRAARRRAECDADKFLFDRGTEALQRTQLARGARVLPAARRHLSAAARTARTPSSASATPTSAKAASTRIILARERVPRVPDVLPARTRAPTTRSTGSPSRRSKQMLGPERDQTATQRGAARARDVPAATTRTASYMPEVRQAAARDARPAVGSRVSASGVFYFRTRCYAGAVARLQGLLERGSGVHASRRGVLLPRRDATARSDAAGAEALPVLREADRGVQGRASTWNAPRSGSRRSSADAVARDAAPRASAGPQRGRRRRPATAAGSAISTR